MIDLNETPLCIIPRVVLMLFCGLGKNIFTFIWLLVNLCLLLSIDNLKSNKMDIKKRLLEIGRDDFQGFLAEIHDKWAYQMKLVNNTLSTMLFDSTLPDLQEDFENFTPTIRNGIAYFPCEKRIGGEDWQTSEIGIPAKIWWRFLYKPKSTFVTYRMVS